MRTSRLSSWFDQIEWRYGLLALLAVAAIYLLSSVPDLGSAERDPVVELAWNLAHPLAFGALAFLILKAFSGTRKFWWERYGLALLASGAYAAVDEWHQSFVPGRHPSVGDFLLDLAGIAGTILVLWLRASATRAVPEQAAGQ